MGELENFPKVNNSGGEALFATRENATMSAKATRKKQEIEVDSKAIRQLEQLYTHEVREQLF